MARLGLDRVLTSELPTLLHSLTQVPVAVT